MAVIDKWNCLLDELSGKLEFPGSSFLEKNAFPIMIHNSCTHLEDERLKFESRRKSLSPGLTIWLFELIGRDWNGSSVL